MIAIRDTSSGLPRPAHSSMSPASTPDTAGLLAGDCAGDTDMCRKQAERAEYGQEDNWLQLGPSRHRLFLLDRSEDVPPSQSLWSR